MAKGKTIGERKLRPESLMMSYGYDPHRSEGAIKSPIFQTSTFVFRTAEEGKAFFELAYGLREKGPSEEIGLIYSRLNNPDLEILEDRLTLWDEAESCAVFESGMAAITTTLLAFAVPGDVILTSSPIYGGTHHLLTHVFKRLQIEQRVFRAGADAAEMEKALEGVDPAKLAAIFIETPANPTNRLVDIRAAANLARSLESAERKIPVIVDNTFLGPLWQQPLKHGADLIIYSATKFIGGHSDVIAGACLGSAEWIKPVRMLRTFFGSMAGPWTGWLLLRSLETLKLRMTAMMRSARQVADYLVDHPKMQSVRYLGLLRQGDEQYDLFQRQCVGPGSLIAFEMVGGEREAFAFLNNLQLVKLAVSLGGTESLAEHPASMTHSDIDPVTQVEMGITQSMIRLSVGVEHAEDLIADLEQALACV